MYSSHFDPSAHDMPHCDRFIYVINNPKVESIKAIIIFLLKAYLSK